jgi:hypothetical protein
MRKGSLKQWPGSIPVGDVGRMDNELENESLGIDGQMAFAAIEAFPAVVATGPPFSVVLTD